VLASQDAKTPPTPQTTAKSLTNEDVLDMMSAGLSQEIVIAKIAMSACEFDTSPTALKVLKTSNVPEAVILAMIHAPTGSNRQGLTDAEPSVPGHIDCNDPTMAFSVYPAPPTQKSTPDSESAGAFKVKCADRITVLNPNDKQAWVKIRDENGQVGYISFAWVSKEKPKASTQVAQPSPESKKREETQKANDDLEDCRVRSQNEYDTKMSAANSLALSPYVRVAASNKLKQNLDAELRECRTQYEMRLKAIEGE
jgi:hypothetical protein